MDTSWQALLCCSIVQVVHQSVVQLCSELYLVTPDVVRFTAFSLHISINCILLEKLARTMNGANLFPDSQAVFVELVHCEPGAPCCLTFCNLLHATVAARITARKQEWVTHGVKVTRHVGDAPGWSGPGIRQCLYMQREYHLLPQKLLLLRHE